ncbi:MAG TPA: LuxR C-terminal-related transcriptional regulator [Longimicrobiaceae bacterium]|nr:LuxR C-terminal-related transcriptional regulator [Longimicrobiaceae bacterium]
MGDGFDAHANLIRALLSPLESALLDPWRASVVRYLLEVTRADAAIFLLDEKGAAPVYISPLGHCDRGFEQSVRRYCPAETAQVCHIDTIACGRSVALVAPFTADGCAVLAICGPPSLITDEVADLMRALDPAFRAGVDLRRRFGSGRAALARTLDGLNQPVMLCDDSGRCLHANAALANVPEGAGGVDALTGSMERFARSLARNRSWQDGSDTADGAEHNVATPGGTYRLRSSRVSEAVFGGGNAILIAAEAPAPLEADPAELRKRFGFTVRQAEVARELVSGCTNSEIAARLGVSAFTVQKHVRKVLEKLQVSSRARVRGVLMNDT